MTARRWQITQLHGWLRIEDTKSLTVIEAQRIAYARTTRGGFKLATTTSSLLFEAGAAHARECVDRVWSMLAVI